MSNVDIFMMLSTFIHDRQLLLRSSKNLNINTYSVELMCWVLYFVVCTTLKLGNEPE